MKNYYGSNNTGREPVPDFFDVSSDWRNREKKPFAGTIFFALGCGIAFIPAFKILAFFTGGYIAFRLILWTFLAAYGIMLYRWSSARKITAAFPLALLLVLILAGLPKTTFLISAIVVLAWIRTGICFPRPAAGGVLAEAVLTFGGALLVNLVAPYSTISWAMAIWLFFLVQSLYFILRPGISQAWEDQDKPGAFEQARQKAQRILSGDV